MTARAIAMVFLAGVATANVTAADSALRPPLVREPAYESKAPRYAVLTFGEPVELSVWLVHDGAVLYADRNGNGDLTDADERIEVGRQSFPAEGEFEFVVGDIRVGSRLHKDLRVGGSRLKHLAERYDEIRNRLDDEPQVGFYRVTVDVEMAVFRGAGIDGRVPQMAWFSDGNGFLTFATDAAAAPVIRFDASWRILRTDPLRLTIGRRTDVYLGIGTPGIGKGTSALIAYDKLVPAGVYPEMKVTYPAAQPGETPLEMTFPLRERCCYVNLHGPVQTPETVGAGQARVELSLAGWIGGLVAPLSCTAEIVAPKTRIELQPVSPRLVRELTHVSKTGWLAGIQFSPDGSRLVAGGYPGGVVEVWDVATGHQLTTIDTGNNRLMESNFAVARDWSRLYVARTKHHTERVERDGEVGIVWNHEGDIRAWDLATGHEVAEYLRTPRGVYAMTPSPDGTRYLLGEQVSTGRIGEFTHSATLWDAGTGEFRTLGEGLYGYGVFSADGRTVAVCTINDQSQMHAVKTFDVGTISELNSFSTGAEDQWYRILRPLALSVRGDRFVAEIVSFPEHGDYAQWRSRLQFWDTDIGRELTSISAVDEQERFSWQGARSPDATLLALGNSGGNAARLHLVNLEEPSLSRTITLDESANSSAYSASFSPDGRWIAIATQVMPPDMSRSNPEIAEMPQPRIHLIEIATGVVRETLVAPQGMTESTCFSPDGKTLATSGEGRVLLWDIRSIVESPVAGP